MSRRVQNLADLMRSMFSVAELKHFVRTLDFGVTHDFMSSGSIVELCDDVAWSMVRWGLTDADVVVWLHECRPHRRGDILAYYRKQEVDGAHSSISLELRASIEGQAAGVYRLRPGQLSVIGRSEDAEIRMNDELIRLSREHAWVAWPATGPRLQDLESKNGTWYRGKRVRRVPLRHGDVFQLGEITLTVREPNRTETAQRRSEETLA